MQTNNCNKNYIDMTIDEQKLWRRLSALAKHQGSVDAPARYYRNKIVKEGLTECEEQEAWEMLDEWGY